MSNDIYHNPLSDTHHTDNDTSNNNNSNRSPRVSFLAAKEAVRKTLSNNSSISSASIKTNNSNNNSGNNNSKNGSVISNISNNSHNNTTNTHNDTHNNTHNNTNHNNDTYCNNDEIYSRLKSTAIQTGHGPVEYVYSIIDKEHKNNNNINNKNNNNEDDNNNDNNNNYNNSNDTNGSNTVNHDDDNDECYSDLQHLSINNNSNNNNNNSNNNNTSNNNNNSTISRSSRFNDVYESIEGHKGDNKDKDDKHISTTEDFYAVFLGSMLVDLQRLKDDKVSYVTECIRSVAGLTSEITTLSKTSKKDASNKKVTLSENRGMSVVMRMEGGYLRVLERGTSKTRLLIYLNHIRMWGVGKEKNSRELAVISKDEEVQSVLCRVFLCEKEASSIAKSFYDVCQKLALKRKKVLETTPASTISSNGTTSSNESKSASRLGIFKSSRHSDKHSDKGSKLSDKSSKLSDKSSLTKEDKRKEAIEEKAQAAKMRSITQQTLPLTPSRTTMISDTSSNLTIKTTCSDGYKTSLPSHSNDEVACSYLGMMEVLKSSGLKTLEYAIDMVKRYVAEENWLQGVLKYSQSGVSFIRNSSTKLSCTNVDITFAGISFKHKNFLGLTVSRLEKMYVHVFAVEEDCVTWFESMKFVCHLHSSKYPKTESTLKKWK